MSAAANFKLKHEVNIMGFFSKLVGNETREFHDDGSFTDRNSVSESSSTYSSDGSLRHFSVTAVPLIGSNRVDTYDGDGNLINSQSKK